MKVPSAILLFAPGAELSRTERRSVIEIKGAVSSMVVQPESSAVLLRDGKVEPLGGQHLTIHSDLMVHLQGSTTIPLMPPTVVDGQLIDDAVHLATVATAPSRHAVPHVGRHQARWEGGVPVLPFAPDDAFDPSRTRLLVDIWATRRDFQAPAFLPRRWSDARPALTFGGLAILESIPPEWAFRREPVPPCIFHFRFWYAEVHDSGDKPFVAPGGRVFAIADTPAEDRAPPTAPVLDRIKIDIKGWRSAVTFAVGRWTFRLAIREAQLLADTVESALGQAENVPIKLPGMEIVVPSASARQIVEWLRSAIAYASEQTN